MIKLKPLSALILTAAAACVPFQAISGSPIYNSSTASATAYDGDISSTDLIENGSSALTSSSGTYGLSAFTDGEGGVPSGGGPSATTTDVTAPSGADTLIYNLGGNGSLGYDITSIQSIAGWRDNNFGAQSFTLYVNGSSTPEGTYTNIPVNPDGNPNSTETILGNGSSPLFSGVTQLEFVYSAVTSDSVIHELDVFGTPSAAAAVPEPSTFALFGAGAACLIMLRRRAMNAAI